MSFKDINISYSYETGKDDPVNEFYVPLLAQSVSYDRIAGFFSSSSLAIAARGLGGLIRNNGKMRLLACPKLNPDDVKTITDVISNPDEYISKQFIDDLSHIEDMFERDHLAALGWMLANHFLEIKLALVVKDNEINYDSLFHQKIGVLADREGNRVSFSGSINETASGWLNNIEEFKVFKSWEDGQDSYLDSDASRFNEFWIGKRDSVKIIDLPQAIADRLIQISTEFNRESFAACSYIATRQKKSIVERLSLFPYQDEAFQMWQDNGYRLLFEMATGTGKTRTAIACINHFLANENRGIVIVSCPQNTLSMQWKKEIMAIGLSFDSVIIADGSNHSWRNDISKEIKLIKLGFHKHSIIYTTHTTACTADFISIICNSNITFPLCFVGDEAHGLGAYKTKNALQDIYKYRIGLSATPSRWFDDYGTTILTRYFGDRSYQFTIAQALLTLNPLTNKPFLIEYEYHPVFIKLTDKEMSDYQSLSTRIKKLASYSQSSDEYQKKLEALLFRRANIEKNAENKFSAFQELLNNQSMSNTIIFASDVQIDDVMKILHSNNISAHKFTQEEGTKPDVKYGGISEREYLIKKFKDGTYQALVAIKCLDEGIDIPIANTAIIMASSTNPREYIQRVGRVIRQAKGKKRAYIYDFVIEPDFQRLHDPVVVEFEKKIFEKELLRVKDMSTNSINNADVLVQITKRLRRLDNGTE